MRLETILNALLAANTSIVGYENWGWPIDWKKRGRQRDAFRARILRMGAEKDTEIERLCGMIYRNMSVAEINMDGEYWFNRPQPKKELHGGRK